MKGYSRVLIASLAATILFACGGSGAGNDGVSDADSTANFAWSAPQPIQPDCTDAIDNLRVGVDDEGNGLAIWRQLSDAQYEVRVCSYRPGEGWGVPQILDIGNPEVEGLKLVMNDGGKAAATWIRYSNPGESSIMTARFNQITGWSAAESLNGGGNRPTSPAEVAITKSGVIFAVWTEESSSAYYNLYVNNFIPGSGWTGVQLLAQNDVYYPKVTVNDDDDALVVWCGQSDGEFEFYVFSRFYLYGAGWTQAAIIDSGANAYYRSVEEAALDSEGNAIVLWTDDGSNTRASRYLKNTGWLGSISFGDFRNPDLAMADDGRAVVTGMNYPINADSTNYRLFDPATGWSAAASLSSAGLIYYPGAAMDKYGTITIAGVTAGTDSFNGLALMRRSAGGDTEFHTREVETGYILYPQLCDYKLVMAGSSGGHIIVACPRLMADPEMVSFWATVYE